MKKTTLLLLACIFAPVLSFSQDSNQSCNCYYPFDTVTFQTVPFTMGPDSTDPPYYKCGNNTTQAIKLPFKFCFYGKNFDTIYIGNKGEVSFVKPIFDFTSGNFPAGNDTMMIAPFWANINNTPFGTRPPGVGEAWYKVYTDHLVVNWAYSCYYTFDDDIYDSFKLTLTDGKSPVIPGGNNVEFCYRDSAMQWASADSSGGSMGFNGIPATVGVNRGDGSSHAIISRFSLPGLTYYGPTSATNGLYWLEGKSFILNTCVTEKNIPPVIINPGQCDTFNVCRYDSTSYAISFLCAEQGQKAKISVSDTGLGGFTLDTTTHPNSIINVKFTVFTGGASLGYHTINVTATDNSSPPQSSTFPVVLNVGICTGINEVNSMQEQFTISPNANNGIFNLSFSSPLPGVSLVEVYNIMGEKVYSAPFNIQNTTFRININNQPAGMYFVKVLNKGTLVGVKKMVVQ